MLSSVTLYCQVTMSVMFRNYQLSEVSTTFDNGIFMPSITAVVLPTNKVTYQAVLDS